MEELDLEALGRPRSNKKGTVRSDDSQHASRSVDPVAAHSSYAENHVQDEQILESAPQALDPMGKPSGRESYGVGDDDDVADWFMDTDTKDNGDAMPDADAIRAP